jgi:hypothetical protein
VAAYADAVIVGSAFVRRILDASDHAGALAGVAELAVDLADGVRETPGAGDELSASDAPSAGDEPSASREL